MISASMVKDLRAMTGAGMLDCKNALEATKGNIDEAIDWLREKGVSKALKKADRIATEGSALIKIGGNKAVILEINSETDFVAKNDEFKEVMTTIIDAIYEFNPSSVDDVLKLTVDGMTIMDFLTAKIATIGEKIFLRRFITVNKNDNQTFGAYIHNGGKIAVLMVIDNVSSEVCKDVAMHVAAMHPTYIRKEEVPVAEIESEKEILKLQAINEGKNEQIALKMVEGRIQKYYKEICLEEQPFVKDGDISVLTYVSNNGGKIQTMIRYEVGEGMEKRVEDFASEVAKQIENK